MRIFIDCEWNGARGDLISMALCAENGDEWYEVLPCSAPVPWVAANVLPILDKAYVSRSAFRNSLARWLSQFDAVHIIADWPEDVAYFCSALITGPGTRLDTPPLTMEVVRVDAPSKVPHNALWDARGIRDYMTYNVV